MKTLRRAVRILACGLCAATAMPALSAERQSGFYVGISAGESTFDLEKSEFDGVMRGVLLSEGFFVINSTSTFEDSDDALSLFAGYHFNPYISVEAGHIDLGAAEYRSLATVNPPGPVSSASTSMSLDVETEGFTLAALGSLPLTEMIDLHGRFGFLFASTDLSVAAQIESVSDSETDSLDSNGVFYGVGAGLNLGEHWSLSLDWTRYDNVGDEDEDDDARTEAGFDIDALSFSAMFRF